MSALPPDEPGQDGQTSLESQQLQQLAQGHAAAAAAAGDVHVGGPGEGPRKAKGPSVRRACVACHSGKTRCSEVLPCQSCLKRGLGASCAYPDPDAPTSNTVQFPPPPVYATLQQQQYYDYSTAFTGPSTSTFRPAKRPRQLTDEEAAAITRGFTRGDFYVGTSAPVRIDPRLPVRLTLGEGDHVHFTIGETLVP